MPSCSSNALSEIVRKCLCNQGLRAKLCRSSTKNNYQSLQSTINSFARDSILDRDRRFAIFT